MYFFTLFCKQVSIFRVILKNTDQVLIDIAHREFCSITSCNIFNLFTSLLDTTIDSDILIIIVIFITYTIKYPNNSLFFRAFHNSFYSINDHLKYISYQFSLSRQKAKTYMIFSEHGSPKYFTNPVCPLPHWIIGSQIE